MTRRLLSMAGIVIAGTVLLTGCGAMGASTVSPGSEPAVSPDWGGAESPQEESGDGGTDASGGDSGASGGDQQQAADEDRAVIISGTVAMKASDPLQTADAVADAALSRSGTIDRRSQGASTDFEPAWATLTVRVPAAEVDGMLDTLRELAEVTRLDMGEQVVTNQVRDLEVRVNASRASVDRHTDLLATAADTETLLEEQVAMSTIEVQIRSTTVEGPTGTPSFWDGLVNGWNAFLAWGAAFLFGLGQAIPTLVILALLGLLAWLIIRRVMRRMPSRATGGHGTTVVNPVGAPQGSETAKTE